jgi:hypothetical protein
MTSASSSGFGDAFANPSTGEDDGVADGETLGEANGAVVADAAGTVVGDAVALAAAAAVTSEVGTSADATPPLPATLMRRVALS